MNIRRRALNLATEESHKKVSSLIIMGLIFIRIPFYDGILFFFHTYRLVWLEIIFQISTYLLTALFILWERDQLADYYVDRLSLAIIILIKPVETIIRAKFFQGVVPGLAFPKWPSLMIWLTAIFLVIMLRRKPLNLPKFRLGSFRPFLIGIVFGIVSVVLLGYPVSLILTKVGNFRNISLIRIFVTGFLYQLGYAAITEEPLFRGFLWGYLRKSQWKEKWIWLFQAGLFAIAHLHHLRYPGRSFISVLVIIPVAALIFGLSTWRTRSIAASMAAHATYNALPPYAGYFFFILRHGH